MIPPPLPTEFRAVLRNASAPSEMCSRIFRGLTESEVIDLVERDGNRIESIHPQEGEPDLAHEMPSDRWISFPIIRLSTGRKSFSTITPRCAALFRDGLTLFHLMSGRMLPNQAFACESIAEFARVPGALGMAHFPWHSITAMNAERHGIEARLHLKLADRGVTFSLPLAEARSVVEGSACLLGSRFRSTISAGDFHVRQAPGNQSIILGIVAFLISAATCFWGSLQFGGDEFAFGTVMGPLAFLYGSYATILSALFVGGQWMKRPSLRAAGVEPYRSQVISFLLKIVGIALFAVGFLIPELIVRRFVQEGDSWWLPLMFATSFASASIGGLLLYGGYRIGLGAKGKCKEDKRSPFLYLRSFGDDGKHNLNARGWLAQLLGLRPITFLEMFGPVAHLYPPRMLKLFFGTAADTAEEQIGRFLSRHGPFRAVGKPGERFATGGAERFYMAHDGWQEKILELMDSSRAVLLQPASTEGVWWEIQKATERIGPRRLLLSLVNFSKSQQDYDDFRQRFGLLVGTKLPRTLGKARFIYFTDESWSPCLLEPVHRSPMSWSFTGVSIDIGRTLAPFLTQLPEPIPDLPPPRVAKPVLVRMNALAAVFVGAVIPLCGLIAIKLWVDFRMSYTAALAGDGYIIRQAPGRLPVYEWQLGKGWEELRDPGDGSRVFSIKKERLIAKIVDDLASKTHEELLQDQVALLDKVSVEPPELISQRRMVVDGRDWLMAEVRYRCFTADDLESISTTDQMKILAAQLISQVDPEEALGRIEEVNQPYRQRLAADELEEMTWGTREQVAYLACHSGASHDFTLIFSTDLDLSRFVGYSAEKFFERLASFRILPNPMENEDDK